MAKRFTDTDKWKRPWFNDLDLKAKFFWMYLLDTCDHRGVWFADFKLASFQIGFKVTETDVDSWFGDKVQRIDGDKYFIRSFVDFQYGELSPSNNAHRPIIKLLTDLESSIQPAPHEPLNSPSRGAQDKDKDKDKDKEEEKSEIEKIEIGADELLQLWNDNRGALPPVVKFTAARKTKARTELQKNPDAGHWYAVIRKWLASDFCMNDWKPGFDDLLNEQKRTVTLEGRYDNRKPKAGPNGIVRAPLRAPPTEAVKLDGCVGELSEDGPRTFSPERLQELKRTLGVG